MGRARAARASYKKRKTLSSQVRALTRTIETKEGTRKVTAVNLAHNNLTVFAMNPFESTSGTGDPMVAGTMQRIGDSIAIQKLEFNFMVRATLGRSKVYFRFMLIRMAKGDTLSRSTLFQEACDNKMIDKLNTERFTIMASKTFNVFPPNAVATAFGASGETSGGIVGVPGSRIFRMNIPGRKFGPNGVIRYENQQGSQVKFYDYKLCCVAYDWNNTPQDINNVGYVDDGYVKTYFKDA